MARTLLKGALACLGGLILAGCSHSPSPMLWVANGKSQTVEAYSLNGISPTSSPTLSLSTLQPPNSLAFDASGDLWVGEGNINGGICSGALEEFRPPFRNQEHPSLSLTTSAPITDLAFDAQGNLWTVSFCSPSISASIQSYSAASLQQANPSPSLSLGVPSLSIPIGLAFDAQGHLWVSEESFLGQGLWEYTSLSGGSRPTQTINLNSAGLLAGVLTGNPALPGPLAFDRQGNLYTLAMAQHSALPLLELAPNSTSPTPLFSVQGGSLGLALDSQGDLWLSAQGEILEYRPPFSASSKPALSLPDSQDPRGLAIWPIPSGLPLQ